MFKFGRKRLVAEPSTLSGVSPLDSPVENEQAAIADEHPIVEDIALLEKRSFKTYLARIHSHKRLTRQNASWNTSLIALATSTTIASVGQLVEPEMYGSGGNALMVVLAILSLVVSLVVSSMNYGARARAMESSYKRIQQISLSAENLAKVTPRGELVQRYLELLREYEIALESSENHVTADHHRASKKWTKDRVKHVVLELFPYVTLLLPILLFVPFVGWFFDGL